jgi:hypothetical protein
MTKVLGVALGVTWLAACAGGGRGTPPLTAGEPCPFEQNCECAPGITLRWKAASCMAAEQTDDLEQAGVQRCLHAADPAALASLDPCARNLHWKRALCAATSTPERVDACVRDASLVPAIVAGTASAGLGEHCADPRSARAALAGNAR